MDYVLYCSLLYDSLLGLIIHNLQLSSLCLRVSLPFVCVSVSKTFENRIFSLVVTKMDNGMKGESNIRIVVVNKSLRIFVSKYDLKGTGFYRFTV